MTPQNWVLDIYTVLVLPIDQSDGYTQHIDRK